VPNQLQRPLVLEFVAAPKAIEEMYFVLALRRSEQTTLCEMIRGTFPTQQRSDELIAVLLLIRFFFLRNEQDDFVVPFGGYYTPL